MRMFPMCILAEYADLIKKRFCTYNASINAFQLYGNSDHVYFMESILTDLPTI